MPGEEIPGTVAYIPNCFWGPVLVGVCVGAAMILLYFVYRVASKFLVKLHDVSLVPVCIGVPLLSGGIYGVACYHACPLAHSVFEAVVVAGAIITFVDPILKWLLLKEFAKDLFPYMIGFDLPQEVKERLRDFVNGTTLYRKLMRMSLELLPQGDEVRIKFATYFCLVNPTSETMTYHHHLEFEDAEQTSSLRVTRNEKELEPKPAAIKERSDDGVYSYWSDPIQIEPSPNPSESDTTNLFKSEYEQIYPKTGFHLQTFGLPTIGFTLTLTNDPSDLEVMATSPDASEAGKSRRLVKDTTINYKKVFMKGDSINIRWRPKSAAEPGATLSPPPAAAVKVEARQPAKG